jgi:hypothetical protein
MKKPKVNPTGLERDQRNQTIRRFSSQLGKAVIKNKAKIKLFCNEKGRKAYVDVRLQKSSTINLNLHPGLPLFRVSVEYYTKDKFITYPLNKETIKERIIIWIPYPNSNFLRGYTLEKIMEKYPFMRFTTIKWGEAIELLRGIAKFPDSDFS